MGKKALELSHISMRFNLSKEKTDTLKDYMIKFFRREIKYNEFWALKDVSFAVEKGDRVGVLGLNGAGKSTLLKVIAGVFKPTEGTVKKSGKVAPLIELGAGFEKEYTGSENIFLNGALLGYTREFIEEKYDEIVEFSELGEFIDVPVKNYSSGMRARLGFSIATMVSPEILILDEVLSVGDAKFRKKSEKKILDMFDDGVTVLFVSHSLAQVKRLCNKAMILDHGKLLAYGDIDEVAAQYEKILGSCDDASLLPAEVRKQMKKKKKLAAQRKKERAKKRALEKQLEQIKAEQLKLEQLRSEAGEEPKEEALEKQPQPEVQGGSK